MGYVIVDISQGFWKYLHQGKIAPAMHHSFGIDETGMKYWLQLSSTDCLEYGERDWADKTIKKVEPFMPRGLILIVVYIYRI